MIIWMPSDVTHTQKGQDVVGVYGTVPADLDASGSCDLITQLASLLSLNG